jgi:hypothetical protein
MAKSHIFLFATDQPGDPNAYRHMRSISEREVVDESILSRNQKEDRESWKQKVFLSIFSFF